MTLTDDDRKVLESYGVKLIGDPVKDLYAVYSRMVEKGEWEEFYRYIYPIFERMVNRIRNAPRGQMMSAIDNPIEIQIVPWLFCLAHPEQIPERMKMVAEWLKSKGAA